MGKRIFFPPSDRNCLSLYHEIVEKVNPQNQLQLFSIGCFVTALQRQYCCDILFLLTFVVNNGIIEVDYLYKEGFYETGYDTPCSFDMF